MIPAQQRDVAQAPLPRMRPVEGPWVTVDGTYASQLAEKARLVAERPGEVLAALPGSAPVQAEALALTLAALADHPDFAVGAEVLCPDGRRVRPGAPLPTLAALLQEDICLLDKRGDEHVLVAAALCFPAGWTLDEKLGRPLTRIHGPVPDYPEIAARVQRFMEGLRPGRPIWRANLLGYPDAQLFRPRREAEGDDRHHLPRQFDRSERQTLLRLPETGAVMFAIHTSFEAAAPE